MPFQKLRWYGFIDKSRLSLANPYLVQASVARCLRTPPVRAIILDLSFGLVTAYAATATGA